MGSVIKYQDGSGGSSSGTKVLVEENRFRFITADSVYKLKSGLEIYVAPFQWAVWTTIFVAIATTTAAVLTLLYFLSVGVRGRHEMKTRKRPSLTDFGALCWDTFFWNSRILLEQCDTELPPILKAYIDINIDIGILVTIRDGIGSKIRT